MSTLTTSQQESLKAKGLNPEDFVRVEYKNPCNRYKVEYLQRRGRTSTIIGEVYLNDNVVFDGTVTIRAVGRRKIFIGESVYLGDECCVEVDVDAYKRVEPDAHLKMV